MSASMSMHDLYLPAGTTFDLARAEAVAAQLCRQAGRDDIVTLITHGWIDDDTATDAAPPYRLAERREQASRALRHHVQRLARSLTGRDVLRFRFDPQDSPGVDAYMTGGMTPGDGPTDAADTWTFLFQTHLLPDGWSDQIGAAAGLIHPSGTGSPVCQVTFRAWGPTAEVEQPHPA